MFSAALTDRIQIASQSGVDGSGRPSYGVATHHNARVEKKTDVVYADTGEEKTSSHTIYLQENVNTSDRIYLPGEDPDSDPGHSPLTVESSGGILNTSTLTKVQV